MTTKEKLVHEIEDLPDPVVDEVMDFVQFLKRKKGLSPSEPMLLSEEALKKEWMNDAEDEAWRNL